MLLTRSFSSGLEFITRVMARLPVRQRRAEVSRGFGGSYVPAGFDAGFEGRGARFAPRP